MGLHILATLIEYGLLLWLGAMALAVLYRLLNGEMVTTGLLAHDDAGAAGGETTPERSQYMLVILGAAAVYAYQAINMQHGVGPIKSLPEVPQNLLLIFGGSNVLYLSGKISRSIR